MSNIDFFLIIPLMAALLITLAITTTYPQAQPQAQPQPSSTHGNHDIDKSILFIAFFGVVMLNVALILAPPLDDNGSFFGLGLAWLVAAFLQVKHIIMA